jgi:outer membrane biogenesis lipoprotein LolB
MKSLRILLAAFVVFVLAGCRSDKHLRVAVDPSPEAAPSWISYVFDEDFRAYFGPEGVAGIEKALREKHPLDDIQIEFSEFGK